MLPIQRSKSMMRQWHQRERAKIALNYHLTLEVRRSGHGDEYHLGSMAQVTYTAMLVSQQAMQARCAGLFREAKQDDPVLPRAGLETGVWMADEKSCAILGEILTVFDQQLATAPLEEF